MTKTVSIYVVDKRLSPGKPQKAKKEDAIVFHVDGSWSISKIAKHICSLVPRNSKISYLWLMGHGTELIVTSGNMTMAQPRGGGKIQLGTGLHNGTVGDLAPVKRHMQPAGRCIVYACSAGSSARGHAANTSRVGDGAGLMQPIAMTVGVPVVAPEDTQVFQQFYVSTLLSGQKISDFAIGAWEGPVNLYTADGKISPIKKK